MPAPQHSVRSRTLLVVVGFVVGLVALGACTLTTNFSELTGGTTPASSVYSLGGRVSGLEGTSLTLLRNAEELVMVAADGPFVFAEKRRSGDRYIVTVLRTDEGRKCTVDKGEGQVGGADVSDVVVACASSSTALSSLTLSSSVLSPPFSSGVMAYTATPLAIDVCAPAAPVMVTATAVTPGATLKINGVAAASGQPSAVGVLEGKNTVTVVVRSEDGARQATYTIVVEARSQEAYVKASNTSINSAFGSSTALSADGTTLAVGARKEAGTGKGINGGQGVGGGESSGAVYVFRRSGGQWAQEAFIKASNTLSGNEFGWDVALSSDGNVLAVGARNEPSGAAGINGDQFDVSAERAGAVYVFRRTGKTWVQEAYVKPSNTRSQATFSTVALSGDGTLLAVGAPGEPSNAKGIDGDQNDVSAPGAGAVYLFRRGTATWAQEAYVKASNTRSFDGFGASLAMTPDGSTFVVGAPLESGAATGINGNENDPTEPAAGAAYVYSRSGASWTQTAYVKASNARTASFFGFEIGVSADGATMAIGATGESSASPGIGGNQDDRTAKVAGAAYVFARTGPQWKQTAYIKASAPRIDAHFGDSLALSADGSRLAVGAPGEGSGAVGLNGDEVLSSAPTAGAAYTFVSTPAGWVQRAYVKPTNTRARASFGISVAMTGDGHAMVVGAPGETSLATGINGNQAGDIQGGSAGAAYVFR